MIEGRGEEGFFCDRDRCENPGASEKKSALSSRGEGTNPKRRKGGGKANESRAAAVIAGRVIERKRNYGVHGAASRGSRVITQRHRGAIVP